MGRLNKQNTALSFLVFLMFSYYYGQNLQVVYDVKFKSQKSNDLILSEQMLLEISVERNESFYQSNNKVKYDSLTLEINKLGNSPAGNAIIDALPSYTFNHTIYKNFKKRKFIISESIQDQWYSTDFSFLDQWDLSKEFKNIQGYKCNKATTNFGGRRWVAWYASEIPFHDGPYKFHGLPGLILEISSDDGEYHFTTIGIQNKENGILPIVKTLKLSNQQLLHFKTKTAEEPSLKLKQAMIRSGLSGSTVNVVFDGADSNENNSDLYERINSEYWQWMKKHNNPIEKHDIWLK